jgi:hypothetical protein
MPSNQSSGLGPEPRDLSRPAAGALLLGLWSAFFALHLPGDAVVFDRDLVLLYHPLRAYLHERLGAAELPEWYPHESLGVPLVGQVVGGVFHPQSWLLLPFDPVTALHLNVVLLYLVGLAGAYRLARTAASSRWAAVAGASAFAFGGYAVGMSNNLPYLGGFMTLPWVAWGAHRVCTRERLADAGLLGLAWALVFLAGDAQSALLVPLLFVPPLLVGPASRRKVALLALSGGVALLLVGAELLPALAVGSASVRALGAVNQAEVLLRALSPLRLPELVVAGYVPDPAHVAMSTGLFEGGYGLWSRSLFAGALVVLCAVAALLAGGRRRLAWGGLGAAAVLLALADHGLLLPLLWKLVPPLARLRFPEKYLAFLWVAFVPLTASGAEALLRRPAAWSAAAAGAAGALLIAAGLSSSEVLPGWLWSLAHAPAPSAALLTQVAGSWARGLASSGGVALGMAAVLWLARSRPRAAQLLPVLVFAELWGGNGDKVPLTDRASFDELNTAAEAVVRAAEEGAPPARVMVSDKVLFPAPISPEGRALWTWCQRSALGADVGGFDGVGSFGETLPATPARFSLLLGFRAEHAARWGPGLNGCFRVEPRSAPPREGERTVLESSECRTRLVRVPCGSRASLAATRPVPTPDAALTAMSAGLPEDTVVWEGGPALARGEGAVRWLEYLPERLVLEAESDRPTALVLAEQFAAGWTATVDGEATPIWPTSVTARGVSLPAGRHRIELRYATPGLREGLFMSAAGLFLVALLIAVDLRRRTRSPS